MIQDDITHEEHGGRGRYALARDGHEAELTTSRGPGGLVIAEHTFVPHALRGQGLAGALTMRLARDARTQGARIVPRCSYVEAWRRHHPDWADVFEADAPGA